MLLAKQALFPATKKHFGLFRDPFAEDIRSAEDVFTSADVRYVREALFQTAKHGGFMAVVGESGAGKSTLRRDLIDRINQENAPIQVIEPYIIAMEDNDVKGKTLKAAHIAEAIISTLSPLENVKRSPEARFRQLHRVIIFSSDEISSSPCQGLNTHSIDQKRISFVSTNSSFKACKRVLPPSAMV